jgi:hypothetical protein
VFRDDSSLSDLGTLWWCHYCAASDPNLIVWNRLANGLIPGAHLTTTSDWREQFLDLEGRFTETSIRKHVAKEIRSLLDAYVQGDLTSLAYIEKANASHAPGVAAAVPDRVLLACLILYRDRSAPGATAIPFDQLAGAPNSPGLLLRMDSARLRSALDRLGHRGLTGLETRADLDQVRVPIISPALALAAYYAERRDHAD